MRKPFDIIFNDEHIVVVNKLVKILSQPNTSADKYTVTYLLEEYLNHKVYPCHRLDKETTGLLIYAKDKPAQSNLMNIFKDKKIKKKYYAFVNGILRKDKGVLAGEIIDKYGSKFGEKAKYAKSFFRVVERFSDFTFIELEPLTGRTNQLRIQLADKGVPILGDQRYAFRRDFKVKFRRLALHASFLAFRHPISNQYIEIKAEMPEDMSDFLKIERKNRAVKKR
ncbi:MAG: RluA family pseudouridine synthase [Candidatus Omnitrophica bacterium]|nr:RluA family pseudouridine synthase [Candidatus Omnitrophota bacterium]